jgi:hypothetical protein
MDLFDYSKNICLVPKAWRSNLALTSCFTVFVQVHLFQKMAADAPSNILAENAVQFAQVPQVAGQKPYRHTVCKAFYPVTPALPPGVAALPLAAATSKKKPGLMGCSFVDVRKEILAGLARGADAADHETYGSWLDDVPQPPPPPPLPPM